MGPPRRAYPPCGRMLVPCFTRSAATASPDYSWVDTNPKRKRLSYKELASLARRLRVRHPAAEWPAA